VTDWQPLTANDSYLVVASDGVFEKTSLQDVCDLLWEVHSYSNMRSECAHSSYSLADLIVNNALKKGSIDNVAAIVIPLESVNSSANSLRGSYIGLQESSFKSSGIYYVGFGEKLKENSIFHHLFGEKLEMKGNKTDGTCKK